MTPEATLPLIPRMSKLDVGTRPDCGLAPSDSAIAPCALDSRSDEEVISRIACGSKEALSILFQRHARVVYTLAWRILRDAPEAEDLRQEVFLYLFKNAAAFDPHKASAISWIQQITYHRAIDRRRYLTHRQHYDAAIFDEIQRPQENGSLSADHLDGKTALKTLREQLPPEQRKTLELHIFEGYSFREIAEHSGQTLGNVRHHYYRAIERLRANLFSRTD